MKAYFLCRDCPGALVSGCSDSNSNPTAPSANVPFSTVDLRVGTGAEATTGRRVTVNYTGWLYNSAAPTTRARGSTRARFSFTVGQGVIPGFSQGIVGMRVGGLRRVTIPPNLAYGAQAQPDSDDPRQRDADLRNRAGLGSVARLRR